MSGPLLSDGSIVVEVTPPDLVVSVEVSTAVPSVSVELAGSQGPSGTGLSTYLAAVPLSGHRAIAVGADGLAVHADSSSALHIGRVVGVSLNAADPNDPVRVRRFDVMEHEGWSWSVGPVILGADGALVQAPAPSAIFTCTVGWALSPTRLLINLMPPVRGAQ